MFNQTFLEVWNLNEIYINFHGVGDTKIRFVHEPFQIAMFLYIYLKLLVYSNCSQSFPSGKNLQDVNIIMLTLWLGCKL